LKGKSAFELIHKDEREHVWNELQKLLTNTKETKGVQHRFLKADGTWIWLESKGANHLDNKSVAGILINARDIDDRVKLQKKLDNELRNRQKELTTAVINAQELERSQLGLELHDNVNQVLTTVKLYNEMFLSGISQDKELIQKSTVYLQDCINEIRSISKRLSAPTLGHISLHDSIQELIESIILTRRIEILFRPYGIVKLCISRELHLTIYRIVQEGLNNVIKYAEATTAIIAIRHWENTLNVTIYDDGKGFDTKVKRSGIGIANMRSRAENMGGKFEINSTPGSGCAIKIVFPLIVEEKK
jgi:signal transduction histidine kinase